MTLSTIFSRLRKPDAAGDDTPAPAAQAYPTRALPRFVADLSAKDQPVLLDLGPVVGANVTFFGELGCKLVIEHLAKDVDRHVRDDLVASLPVFLESRFPQEAGTFDGIVCWDVFDHLDRAAAQVLARELVRLLRPDGVVLAFFTHTEVARGERPTYTRHTVLDRRTLEHRQYEAARTRQRPLPNRDIQRMFEPLAITDQFLQRTGVRELVLKKAAHAVTAA